MIRRRSIASFVLLLAFVAKADAQQEWDRNVIQTAADAARLSSQDAGKGLPVRIQGVVTWASSQPPLFFVQDASGGVAVTGAMSEAVRAEVKPGAIVDVQGVTASGEAAPSIAARAGGGLEIRFLGDGEVPEPQPARAAQLKTGALADLRVEIEGVVRAVETRARGAGKAPALEVTFAAQGERLVATVPDWREAEAPEQLIGASVRVRGVFHGNGLSRFPMLANRFLVNELKDIAVETAAPPPFELPVKTIGQMRSQFAASGVADRVRLRGVVTLSAEGAGMFIENNGEAIWVETAEPPEEGASVEIAGFPGTRDGAAVLQDARWRPSKIEVRPVPPPVIAPEDALGGNFNARVVRIEALLLTLSNTGESTTLILQSGDRVFLARTISAATPLAFPAENSWLRVTGVCVNTRAPRLPAEGDGGRGADSFHLLLAGPDAVEVARGPTWWTLQRIMSVIGVLSLAVAASVGWVAALRRRVSRQSEQIHMHLAREAVAEERVRIARELHDSLQQDLLGITMQIKATERLLTAPDRARGALQLASAMVRRSQAETHRAIWDLRDDTDTHPNLVATLRDVLRGLSTDASPDLEIRGEGDVRPLPAAIENHMLRIAQEAVTNALKHGGAANIEVELRYEPERVTLLVRDDGRGFDADHPPTADTGHFGLFGMRERALKIGGDLRITSRHGAGTAVHLDVPLALDDLENYPTQLASAFRLASRPSRPASS